MRSLRLGLVVVGLLACAALSRLVVAQTPAPADEQEIPVANTVAPATLVSLQLQEATFNDTIEALVEQTGFAFRPNESVPQNVRNRPPLTLTVQNQPFWSVLRDVCAHFELAVPYWSNERTIEIHPGQWHSRNLMKARANQHGAFLVVLESLSRTNRLDLGEPDIVRRHLDIRVQVLAEPSTIVVRHGALRIERAVDDNRNSLIGPRSPEQSVTMQPVHTLAWQGSGTLLYPQNNPGRKIALIQGYIPALISGGVNPIVIDDPLNRKDYQIPAPGVSAWLVAVRQTDEHVYEATVAVQLSPEDRWPISDRRQFRLIDEQDRGYQVIGTQTSSMLGRRSYTIRFSGQARDGPAGPPVRLVWDMPQEPREVRIPFEFLDLPMP